MQVIPVMDLRHGRAVHATGGDRSRYRVVAGVLGSGRDPLALATGFRDRLGCPSLYLADLDAIAGRGDPHPLLRRLAGSGLEVWCDAGVHTPAQAEALAQAGAARVVIGLETLRALGEVRAIVRAVGTERVVFSLDLRAGRPIARSAELARRDPLHLAEAAAAAGVHHLVCLDLARVGAAAGPDLELLARLRGHLPALACYAGGGVRDARDLAAITGLGCAGALVATALHRGSITRTDLERLNRAAPSGARPTARTPPRPPS